LFVLKSLRSWRIGAVVAVAACLSVLAASAFASGSTLSIDVKGWYAKKHHIVCHKNKPNWRGFHRASTIEYRGFLLPPPAQHYTVRIKIEKCVRGTWKEVHDYFLLGQNATDKHPGRYKAFFPARPFAPRAHHHHRRIAYYRAKALVGTVVSPEDYFFVTSN
jgi:hypothetical protein